MSGDSETKVSLTTDPLKEFGSSSDAGDADSTELWLQVEYSFNIAEEGVSHEKPSFFFELSGYDVEWVQDWINLDAADSSDGWNNWRQENIGGKYDPATYDVYRDDDGKIYVIVTLNDRYIDYVKEKGNDQVTGSVKFSAQVTRDESQSGDKTIFDGEADLTVTFDDRDPGVNKTGTLANQTDPDTQKPIINWNIELTNYYELRNYTLSDTHLNAMIPGTLKAYEVTVDENNNEIRKEIGISANGNNFVFEKEKTSANKIIVTYQSVATDDELSDTSNGHKGYATNTVTLNYKNNISSTGEVDLNADFKAHITKEGKPSYEVTGEKGYIYWTVTVSRNYKGTLNGYVVTDVIDGVQESDMEFVSVTGVSEAGKADMNHSAPWIISGHNAGENVVITYRTPVEKNKSSVVNNTASVTPEGGSTPDNSDPERVTYNDTNLYTLNKDGRFDENTEKITWTITIEVNNTYVNKETLNGYVIEDDAFSRTDIENMTVTAWNNNNAIVSGKPITDIATLTDGKYVVNSTPEYDKIQITYTVPLTDAEKTDRGELKSDETLPVKNTVKVTPDGGLDVESKEGTASVPSGFIGITASKSWNGYFSDDDRIYPVTIVLQKRLGYNGEWTDVESKTIADKNATQSVVWDSLPKKENGETVYYRIKELVADNADVSYSNNNGVNYNSTIHITNTWKNMAVSVSKKWNGDTGHENGRKNVRFNLYKREAYIGDFVPTGMYATLDIETNKITYFNSDGTETKVDAWTDLPRQNSNGQIIEYKVIEDPVEGYTSSGSHQVLTSTGTIEITNTADYFKLTANKNWNDGGYTADREDITFNLYKSNDRENWEIVESKPLTSKANESVSWDWLPAKDSDGKTLYYKIEEDAVPENYSVSYSSDYITATPGSNQSITVTNTWEMMNVHVHKNWVNVSDADKPQEVTMELWSRVEGFGWNPVENANPATVTVKASESWRLENAWTCLPKTTVVDGVTLKIYYAAREVGTSDNYISVYDTNGINGTNWSTVTNKPAKLNVTANKKWNASTATPPSSITVHLEQSTDLGATWTTVDRTDATQTLSDWTKNLEWNDLPVQDASDQEILYRVVENEVEGFNTTYSPAQISANSGNIEITNTQKATYKKYAIKPQPYTGEAIKWYGGDDKEFLKFKVEALSSIIDSITTDDLVLSDDGNYYIFKWYLDLANSNVTIEDMLPENSSLLVDENHAFVLWYSYGMGVYDKTSSPQNTTINSDSFKVDQNIKACSYYVKVPKEIVDNEIATTGKYVQTNRIKDVDADEYVEADLVVSNEGETGTINKKNTNDKSSKVQSAKGLAIGDTRAYYSIDVNPDALYLSSSDNVTVTDTFRILKYLDAGGTAHTGYDLLNAALENVAVYEVDNSTGKRNLLTSGYSYVISQVNDSFIKETDITSAYAPTDSVNCYPAQAVNQTGAIWIRAGDKFWEKYNEGDVITIKLEGETGQPVNASAYPDYVSIDFSSDTFVNGSAIMTIKFLQEVTTDFSFSISGYTKKATVTKFVQTETIEATQHIVTFTIPDGKHIVIEYEYLLTNLDGSPIGRGLSLWLENDSIVYTSGGEESSKADEEQFSVSEVVGTISTGGVSKIVKVDVGNYSIKNLEAEFILAKFDTETGDWIYASDFPFTTSVDKEGNTVVSTTDHNISFKDAVAEESLGGKIPSAEQAKRIKLKGSFNVSFEENTLYKLIELKAPNGYIQTGYVEGESTISDMQDYTTYFAYMYDDATVSDEVKNSAGITDGTEITMLNYLASIEIPNAKPISIGAEKIWEQDPASAMNNPSVTVELWKSYLQNTSGVPNPSSDMNTGAVKVENAADYFTKEIKNADSMTTSYGIGNSDGTFTLIRQGEDEYIWRADKIWENLPNGENGKPVYYYIKEVAYTIGDTTFTLDTDSNSVTYGKYVDENGNVYTDEHENSAEYRPTYSNNALNENGVVNVTNTRRFVIKKIWMRSDGTIMTHPPENPIEIKLEGYLESTKDWQEIILGSNNIVSVDNGWEIEIAQRYLSAYSRFRVTEINPPYNYTISTIYELDGSVGTVKLINKSKSPTQTSLDVTKVWGDDTTHNPVTVVLYQATSGIEEAALAEMSKGTMPENAEQINLQVVDIVGVQSEVILNDKNNWHYTWNNLPYTNEYENRLYYYAVETEVPEGYTVTYDKKNGADQTETITNSIPGALAIDKDWIDTDGNPVTVGSGSIELQLYTATVTSVTISAPVVETTAASTPSQEGDTETETNTLKIMPLGDSITYGYKGGTDGSTTGGYRKYFYRYFTSLGYNVDMVGSEWTWGTSDYTLPDGTKFTFDPQHEGHSGFSIISYNDGKGNSRTGLYNHIVNSNENGSNGKNSIGVYQPDVVFLMIGTNDVLDNYNISSIQSRLQTMVDEVYSQKSDVKLFLISPPRIDSERGYGSTVTNQTLMDSNIESLNNAAKSICESETAKGNYCKYIDVCDNIFGEDDYVNYLEDYTHPSENGYQAIGEYLAEQLDSYLKTGEAPPDDSEEEEEEELVIEEIEDPNILEAYIAQEILKPAGDPITIEPDKNGNWSTVIKDLPKHVEGDPNTLYVYYVLEKNGDTYNVKYLANGQLLSEKGTSEISLTNTKAFEPIDITVNKVWPSELPEGVTIPTHVNVELYSSVTASDDEANWTLEDTVALYGSDWTYTFTDLHGGKFWYVKESADGWSATYDGNGVTGENGTITITNTIDTGSISVNKEWYKENTGNNSSVNVKVYRVAYNDDGTPIYEYQPRLSSTSAAYSLSRMRSAFAAASSKETETEIDLSDIQLNLNNDIQVLANEKSVPLEPVALATNIYFPSLPEGATITSVEVNYTPLNQWYIGSVSALDSWSGLGDLSPNASSMTFSIDSSVKGIYVGADSANCTLNSVVLYYTLPITLEITDGKNTTSGDNAIDSSCVAGDSITFTAKDSGGSVVWYVDDVQQGTGDTFTYTFTSNATVKAVEGTATRTANVTVTPFQITNEDPVILVEGGSSVKLSANNKNGTVTWSSNNEAVTVDENTGEIEFVSNTSEPVTITADHGNGVKDTITVNVQPAEIQLEIDKPTLHNGGTATLTPSKEDVTYSVDKNGVVDIVGNTVKAVGEGTVTITAERNGKTASVTLTVAELAVSPTSGTYNINSTITLTLENVVDGISSVASSNNTAVKWVATSGNTVTLEAVDEGEATITITDGAGGVAEAALTVTIQKAEVELPNIENIGWLWNKTLTPGTDNNWYAELNNLPLTDGNGHTFTYYVVEELPNGVNYYPIYYSEDGGFTLENGKNTSVEITNRAEEVESPPAVLPDAGGSGIKVYYVAGGMIMLLAAAGYIMVRRRKYDTENG